jgi:hypothetical protein
VIPVSQQAVSLLQPQTAAIAVNAANATSGVEWSQRASKSDIANRSALTLSSGKARPRGRCVQQAMTLTSSSAIQPFRAWLRG